MHYRSVFTVLAIAVSGVCARDDPFIAFPSPYERMKANLRAIVDLAVMVDYLSPEMFMAAAVQGMIAAYPHLNGMSVPFTFDTRSREHVHRLLRSRQLADNTGRGI